MPAPAYFAVLPAAGVGQRMAADIPKQYLSIAGKTVLEHTLLTLLEDSRLQKLVVAVASKDDRWKNLAVFSDPRVDVIEGGKERCDSVLNGLEHLQSVAEDNDWILVHDVARPCIRLQDIDRLITSLADSDSGGLLALPATDTIKQVDQDQCVSATLDRNRLWLAQTPQMFRYGKLSRALAAASAQGQVVTDEAAAIELAGGTVRVVEGSATNIKITRPQDLALAEFFLQQTADGEAI